MANCYDPGTSGYSGARGPVGPRGPAGPQGASIVGPQGPRGLKGDKGDKGDTGYGCRGYSGYSGVSGFSGFSGIAGYGDTQGWTERCCITVNSGYVSGGVHSNFQVALRWDGYQVSSNIPQLAVDTSQGRSAKNGGGDVRFSADIYGEVPLPFEVVEFTTDADPTLAVAEIHVLLPVVSSYADVKFYMWWGNPLADALPETDPYGSQAVWDNYDLVLHLNEASGTYKNSTGQSANCQPYGADFPKRSYGILGYGQEFDASNSNYIDCGGSTEYQYRDGMSCSFWFYTGPNWRNNYTRIVAKGYSWGIWRAGGPSPSNDTILFSRFHGGVETDARAPTSLFPLNPNQWYHAVGVFDGTNTVLYVNGLPGNTMVSSNLTVVDGYPLTIGEDNAWPPAPWDGGVDEVRLTSEAWSQDRVVTEFNSHNAPQLFAPCCVEPDHIPQFILGGEFYRSGFSGFSGWSGSAGMASASGWSGVSGYSGNSGLSGYSGESGWSGDSGWSGMSGNSGISGWSGTSGFSGVSGFSGWSGISGWSGWSGVSGYSGWSGTSGFSGTSGWSGFSGYSGKSGFSGSGISGWSGWSGISGWSGWSGISGYSGYSGRSGWSGWSGISGWSGFSGVSGWSGISGYSGLDGADAVAGKLPNSYVELSSPVGTSSGTLEDVTGMSTTITLDEAVEISVVASFELQTQSGASSSVIAVAININGTDYDEYQRYLSGSNDQGIGAIVHRSGELAPGTYTVKLRFRRVSGVAVPGMNHADLLVMAMQGAKGTSGFSGFSGRSGWSGFSGFSGISGYSGTAAFSGSIAPFVNLQSSTPGTDQTGNFNIGVSGTGRLRNIRAPQYSDDAMLMQNFSGVSIIHYDFHSGYQNVRFFNDGAGNTGLFSVYGSIYCKPGGFTFLSDSGGFFQARTADISAVTYQQYSATLHYFSTGASGNLYRMKIGESGIAVGTNSFATSPSAQIHFTSGFSGAGSAPMKFANGVLMTTPEAGAVEFAGDGLYLTTTTGPVRKRVDLLYAVEKTSGSPLTLDESYSTVITNTATAYTVNLPAASGSFKTYIIKNIGAGLCSVTPNGTDTIDTVNAAVGLAQYESITVQDYASGKWVII